MTTRSTPCCSTDGDTGGTLYEEITSPEPGTPVSETEEFYDGWRLEQAEDQVRSLERYIDDQHGEYLEAIRQTEEQHETERLQEIRDCRRREASRVARLRLEITNLSRSGDTDLYSLLEAVDNYLHPRYRSRLPSEAVIEDNDSSTEISSDEWLDEFSIFVSPPSSPRSSIFSDAVSSPDEDLLEP